MMNTPVATTNQRWTRLLPIGCRPKREPLNPMQGLHMLDFKGAVEVGAEWDQEGVANN